MYLIINTAQKNEMFVVVYNGRRVSQKRLKVDFNESEELLPLVDKLLKKARVNLKEVKKILVAVGPGPFTSLRVGIAVANTFAFALGIPVIGFRADQERKINDLINLAKKQKGKNLVYPDYGREPNITTPRKK